MSLLRRRALIKQTGPPPIPTADLIVRLEGGSILDTSGSTNTYDGTLNGITDPTLVAGINGEANGAYNFVSSQNQYTSLGNIVEIKNVQKITISAWLKKTVGNELILGAFFTSGLQGSAINWAGAVNDRIVAFIRNGSVNNDNIIGTPFLGNWTHVCVVFDGSQAVNEDKVKLYVDAILRTGTSGTSPTLTSNNADSFDIGRFIGPTYSDGQIAQILIYDDAISQSDIDTIFAQKTV